MVLSRLLSAFVPPYLPFDPLIKFFLVFDVSGPPALPLMSLRKPPFILSVFDKVLVEHVPGSSNSLGVILGDVLDEQ